MCQLSRRNVAVQPYYLSDKRRSEPNELQAIETIRTKLIANPKTRATILPLIYISVDQRTPDEATLRAYKSLLAQDFMGSQYEWLGWFALEHKGIELSIHKDDKAMALIQKHGNLKSLKTPQGRVYVIDPQWSSEDCTTLFKNFHFPLARYTKVRMRRSYQAMGLADIVDDTWFCFSPIDGKPCGTCNPCKYPIEEGLTERFTAAALERYAKKHQPVPTKKARLLDRIRIGRR